MKKLLIILSVLIIVTSGCSSLKLNANENNSTFLDLSDPLLYAKNIEQNNDLSSWRRRKVQYPGSVEAISKDYLASTIWNAGKVDYLDNLGLVLVFYLDDEFRIGSLQGGIELGGKYELLDNNKVKLFDLQYSEGYEDSLTENIMQTVFTGDEWILSFEVNKENLWYSDHLYGENRLHFWGAQGSEPPFGEVYKINGHSIVKEEWEAVTNARLKFRTQPDKTSQTNRIGFVYQYDIEKNLILDYLLIGAKFTVLGRTEEKLNVDNIENYWYFIRYNDSEFPTYGWVFGEYIETFDEERATQYYEIYMQEVASFN
ncbi:SH3 domain-containing protein [Alkaliphilus peptidifermentans]|uniref:SH3 domain-containing protein n=1 Tax=Alkaliphilus peptidifermentans DSM 18978 TaxID=1120976 RepID=A0A1G5D726_9FIRM|nr:hypothetical protein [Alkaliphilus peptidifermentans]SCY10523.1 hypothetical protein SAMN03080606_00819 [Alkaliphilus peptidifermentans DSM 18978]